MRIRRRITSPGSARYTAGAKKSPSIQRKILRSVPEFGKTTLNPLPAETHYSLTALFVLLASLAAQYGPESSQNDLNIEQERQMLNVVKVIFQFFDGIRY